VLRITANEDHTREMVLNSLGIVTILKPVLGYKQCAEIAGEGYRTGNRSIRLSSAKESCLLKRSGTSCCFRLRAWSTPTPMWARALTRSGRRLPGRRHVKTYMDPRLQRVGGRWLEGRNCWRYRRLDFVWGEKRQISRLASFSSRGAYFGYATRNCKGALGSAVSSCCGCLDRGCERGWRLDREPSGTLEPAWVAWQCRSVALARSLRRGFASR